MDDGRPMRALKASLANPLGEMRNGEGPHRLYAETADHIQHPPAKREKREGRLYRRPFSFSVEAVYAYFHNNLQRPPD
jgi:hypothetical protein